MRIQAQTELCDSCHSLKFLDLVRRREEDLGSEVSTFPCHCNTEQFDDVLVYMRSICSITSLVFIFSSFLEGNIWPWFDGRLWQMSHAELVLQVWGNEWSPLVPHYITVAGAAGS